MKSLNHSLSGFCYSIFITDKKKKNNNEISYVGLASPAS